jgi:hypothetical protein
MNQCRWVDRYRLFRFVGVRIGADGRWRQGGSRSNAASQLRRVFRPGAMNRDQADTDPLNDHDVAKQRLLSDNGRQVARQVGDALGALRIPIGT